MDPIQLLRNSARRYAVVLCRDLGVPMVYVLQRVGSPEFLRLAGMALARFKSEAQDQDELRTRLLGAKTEEDQARVQAELEAAREQQESTELARLLERPEGMLDMLDQADALVMQAVVAIGVGRTDIDLELGLQPADTRPEDICEPLQELEDNRPGEYLRSVRWAGPAEMGADRLQIGMLPEVERMEIFSLIWEAFIPAKAAATFPGSRDARDRGPVGKPVRAKAKRAAAVQRSARGRARSRGDGGG